MTYGTPQPVDWSIAAQLTNSPVGIAVIALATFAIVALAFAFGGRS